ncbi:hypothetical protein LTR36_001720 [Oleoguttula mirabilis]|uniref:Uncharacterized protein n=1 Tax=Oleoguttula mirabilis TaxID=1507867 RepID=A0AAV9JNA8_9PEZI|nr:hypothetical protein LTR36_001720 [Oleoguttula mirabilis]
MRCSAPCGPCQRSEVGRPYEEKIAALKLIDAESWTPSAELMQAENDYATQDFHLRKHFPGPRFAKLTRPEKGEQDATRTRGSLLRNEVQPEDVVGVWTASSGWTGWDSSDGTYKTLLEELAEQEELKDPVIKEYEAAAARELERWQEDVVHVVQEDDEAESDVPISEPADDEEAMQGSTSSVVDWAAQPPEKQQHLRCLESGGDDLERFRCLRSSWLAVAT